MTELCKTKAILAPDMNTTLSITPDSTMAEVEAFAPGARRALFARYHIGGCQSCGFQPTETLAEVCARNEEIDVDEAIEHIGASHQHDLELQISPAGLATRLVLMQAGKIVQDGTFDDMLPAVEDYGIRMPEALRFGMKVQPWHTR